MKKYMIQQAPRMPADSRKWQDRAIQFSLVEADRLARILMKENPDLIFRIVSAS